MAKRSEEQFSTAPTVDAAPLVMETRRLVIATWFIAGASIVALLWTAFFMSGQVKEMERSTNLNWRPFANIETDKEALIGFFYQIGEVPSDEDQELALVDTLPIDSYAYKARRKVIYNYVREVTVWNSGVTPLWMRSRLTALLTEGEWVTKFSKNPERVVQFALGLDGFKPGDVDNVILPGDTTTFEQGYGIARSMTIEEFELIRDVEHRLVLYPYTCIRYSDWLGNEYFALRIMHVILEVDTANNAASINIVKRADEVYRWDVKP